MARNRLYHCSFCGKSQSQVRRLIAGPNGVYICDECVVLCNEIIAETPPHTDEPPDSREPDEFGQASATIYRF